MQITPHADRDYGQQSGVSCDEKLIVELAKKYTVVSRMMQDEILDSPGSVNQPSYRIKQICYICCRRHKCHHPDLMIVHILSSGRTHIG